MLGRVAIAEAIAAAGIDTIFTVAGGHFLPTYHELGRHGAIRMVAARHELGAGYMASILSTKKDLLPSVDDDGWFHIHPKGDRSKAKWPQPIPGASNYYHESSRHLIDCILEDREPIVGIDWGLHITEMMAGAIESSRTGQRYEMTTTLAH